MGNGDMLRDLKRKNAIVEYLDYQIPVTQLNRDMQAAKRDKNAPPTGGIQI